MTARNFHEITPESAERLLDGHGGPEPVARLLDAAAAPGRTHEFRGEDTAVAAFEIHHARRPVPARRRAVRLPAGRILALAAALCGGGAVALAAATGSFGGAPSSAPSAARVSPGASAVFTPSPHATHGPVRAHGPVAPAAPSEPQPAGADGPAALCRDLAAQAGAAQAGLEQGLASSAVPGLLAGTRYAPLAEAAGGTPGVPDYCALLLGLPGLPQPAELATIPASVLGELLAGLPAPALSQVLTELPGQTLSTVLTGLPAGPLGKVLGKLPSSEVSGVLARLPAPAVSRLKAKLPSGQLPGARTGLPVPTPSALPSGFPTG